VKFPDYKNKMHLGESKILYSLFREDIKVKLLKYTKFFEKFYPLTQNILVPLSLQPDGVNQLYFKIRLFLGRNDPSFW